MFDLSQSVVQIGSSSNKHYIVKWKNDMFYANGLPICNCSPKGKTNVVVFPTPLNNKYDKPIGIFAEFIADIAVPYWSLVHEYMKVRGVRTSKGFVVEQKLINNEWVDIHYKRTVKR